jgi:hypothetical protein
MWLVNKIMHMMLTANGVLNNFTDGQDFETSLSYLDERKGEAIDLGKTVSFFLCF